MMTITDALPADWPVPATRGPGRIPERSAERLGHAGACRVCLVRHDREIHAATLSVREWFRARVTRNLDEPLV